MTIAAGFHFNQGILVCADSQFSGPSVKFQAPKLRESLHWGSKNIEAVFAMSGVDGYMQTVVSACEEALFRVNEEKYLDEFTIQDVLATALMKTYKRHFYPHKNYGYVGGPEASIIVGVWTSDHDPMLFWTHETTVNLISNYKCIGSGADIADYSIRPLIDGQEKRTLKDSILLATHALKVAKEYDPQCGGESHFATLNLRGYEGPVTKFQIDACEAYSETFQGILTDLFFASAEIDNAGQCIAKALETIKLKAGAIEFEQQLARQKRWELLKMLTPLEKVC